ncbi:MAG: hypothetical protein Q8K99_04665 [Actinomycetota bacterium]|nr:hypothetical protein [Actinomycetota bacterium]
MSEVEGSRERPISTRALATVFVGTTGLALCVTTLFLGMRAILATGTGFVAVGGPYVIEHPAPDWVWVIPVSILAGWAFGGLHTTGAMSLKGFTIAVPVWVALFLALGWNSWRCMCSQRALES